MSIFDLTGKKAIVTGGSRGLDMYMWNGEQRQILHGVWSKEA